jgi:uncharacterized protein YndB with AHSA1/START domain
MSALEMERHFAARPEEVFARLTRTEFLLQWWGPEGTGIGEHNLDFSKPGPWSATMISPGGQSAIVGGEVLRLEPPFLVELTLSFAEGGGRGPESIILFELAASDKGGTHLRLTQSGLEAEHIADMRDKGWASALRRLERLFPET